MIGSISVVIQENFVIWRCTLASLIWAIIVVLFVLWLLGFSLHAGGSLIFLLLVLAIAGVIYNLPAVGMYSGTLHPPHTPQVKAAPRRGMSHPPRAGKPRPASTFL